MKDLYVLNQESATRCCDCFLVRILHSNGPDIVSSFSDGPSLNVNYATFLTQLSYSAAFVVVSMCRRGVCTMVSNPIALAMP